MRIRLKVTVEADVKDIAEAAQWTQDVRKSINPHGAITDWTERVVNK